MSGIIVVVVLEPGSDWPGHIGQSDGVVALSGGDLLLRTEERLRALRQSNMEVRVAVVACNHETQEHAPGTREQVARALLGEVARARLGRLVLSASAGSSLLLRQQLFSLASVLGEQLRGSSASVSLKFNEAPSWRRAVAVRTAPRAWQT
jgi:hypothetical protein